MQLGWILSLPLLTAGLMTKRQRAWQTLAGLGLGLTTVLLLIGLVTETSASLTIPALFNASWQFHPYGFTASVAFTLLTGFTLVFAYPRSDSKQLAAICFAWASALGIAFANHYMALFLYWEMLTASTTLIILQDTNDNKLNVGSRFFLTHIVAGLIFLMGILLQYHLVGSLEMGLPANNWVLGCFLIGIGTKAAVVPFHFWLPETYPKLSPEATVALSIFTTKVGVYALSRLLPGIQLVAYLGGIMALYGIYMALQQTKMRSLLTYHILSQLGYMVAAIGMGGEVGINGGLLHLLNHMIYKSLLLMIAASVIYMYGTDELAKQPSKPLYLQVFAVIASLAIIGIPPFNGFISKSIIKYATESQPILALMLTIASIGTAVSFGKFLYFGFFSQGPVVNRKPVPLPVIASMSGLAFLAIILGLTPTLIEIITPYSYYSVYSSSSVFTALALGASGFIIFALVKHKLDPKFHHTRNRRLNLSFGFILGRIAKFEDSVTQLNNAQYLVATVIVCTLLTLFTILL